VPRSARFHNLHGTAVPSGRQSPREAGVQYARTVLAIAARRRHGVGTMVPVRTFFTASRLREAPGQGWPPILVGATRGARRLQSGAPPARWMSWP